MVVVSQYQVVFDADLEVVQVKNIGPAPVAQRVVGVTATSSADAIKKAKILVGGKQGGG